MVTFRQEPNGLPHLEFQTRMHWMQVANQENEAVDVGLVQFSSTCVGKNFNIVSFLNGDPPMAPDFSKLNDKPDFRKSICDKFATTRGSFKIKSD